MKIIPGWVAPAIVLCGALTVVTVGPFLGDQSEGQRAPSVTHSITTVDPCTKLGLSDAQNMACRVTLRTSRTYAEDVDGHLMTCQARLTRATKTGVEVNCW